MKAKDRLSGCVRGDFARTLATVLAMSMAMTAADVAGARNRQATAPPPAPKGPVEYLQSLLPWTTVEQPADFVRDTRPSQDGEFMPTGVLPAVSDLKVKTDAELATAKAEFEGIRNAHDAIKAHPPALTAAAPPPPPPPPAAAPKPAKKIAKRKSKPRPVQAAHAD